MYGRLAQVELEQEQGLNILQNLANGKVISEKVRERIAHIWNSPTHDEDKDRNLYNLNNAVTQHLTHEVEDTRFELAERVSQKTLRAFDAASKNGGKKDKLLLLPKGETIAFAE